MLITGSICTFQLKATKKHCTSLTWLALKQQKNSFLLRSHFNFKFTIMILPRNVWAMCDAMLHWNMCQIRLKHWVSVATELFKWFNLTIFIALNFYNSLDFYCIAEMSLRLITLQNQFNFPLILFYASIKKNVEIFHLLL